MRQVAAPAGGAVTWVSLTAGLQHTCGITTTGSAYCWGGDFDGQLGHGGSLGSTSIPRGVATPGGVTWASLAGFERATCGRSTAGAFYCWGTAGVQTTGGSQSTPRLVNNPAGVTGWSATSNGGGNGCGVATDGSAYCWGPNSAGQVGNGTTTNSQSLQRVGAGQTITFDPLPDRLAGSPAFELVASATSGLPVTFTRLSGTCGVNGTTVTVRRPARARSSPARTEEVDGRRLPRCSARSRSWPTVTATGSPMVPTTARPSRTPTRRTSTAMRKGMRATPTTTATASPTPPIPSPPTPTATTTASPTVSTAAPRWRTPARRTSTATRRAMRATRTTTTTGSRTPAIRPRSRRTPTTTPWPMASTTARRWRTPARRTSMATRRAMRVTRTTTTTACPT